MKLLATVLLGSALAACGGGGDDACDPDAPNTICTIVGSGKQGYSGDNGPATEAATYIIQDMVLSDAGELWFLDFNNYVIRVLDKNGIVTTRIGTGELDDSPPPGVASMPAADAGFNHTTDLFFHDGYLYMAAWHNARIKRVNMSTMELENYAGAGKRLQYFGDEGPALDAALDLPSSIALDPNNEIVIMDQANQVIRRVDAQNNIHRVAGRCVVDADVPCAIDQEPLQCPDGVNHDKWVCGPVETECEKPCTPAYGGDDGDPLMARMAQPFGQMAVPAGRIAYDPSGNLIFADTGNNRIRRVTPAGRIETIAGTGEAGYGGDGGPATQAQLYNPIDVEAADDGTIYFTDTFNNCIRKISPDGTISRVVGKCVATGDAGLGFSGDGGDPLEAELYNPYGIELAGKKIYVADSYNNRIRVVNLP